MIFSKRIIRHRIEREAAQHVESRDAILWEIIPSQRICRIKIQGSDTLLQARYPENTHQTPYWLKIGSAVRVQHLGGQPNSVEVIGPGLNVPTPVPGGSGEPPLAAGENTVISGCQLYAVGGMGVRITAGTYRINDVVYSLSSAGLVMTAGSTIIMTTGSPFAMGGSAGAFTVSTAHATMFRIDAFFVGVDGVIDYVVGTPSATNPQIPDIPSTHIMLGWVLVPPGATEITQGLIDYPFVEPVVSQLSAVATLETLTWTDGSTDVVVSVLDQYGRGITGTNWVINASINSGTGTIQATGSTGVSGSSVTFTYHRESEYSTDVEVGESCPVFIEFVLNQNIGITMLTALVLEDISGDLIFG